MAGGARTGPTCEEAYGTIPPAVKLKLLVKPALIGVVFVGHVAVTDPMRWGAIITDLDTVLIPAPAGATPSTSARPAVTQAAAARRAPVKGIRGDAGFISPQP